ncbi:hypothetical protein [Gordonia terrae]
MNAPVDAPIEPPKPLWVDESIDLAVWMNGAFVEVTLGEGWSGRLTADQAARIDAAGFAAALVAARDWSARWDVDTRTYLETQPEPR